MKLATSLVVLSVTCSILLAAPTAQEKFNSADVNNDKVLTIEEFYNDQARKMEKKIKDGKALKGVPTAPQFENVDTNKDAEVTFAEYDVFHTVRQKEMEVIKSQNTGNNKGSEIFQKYDVNKNGSIDKDEFRKLYLETLK